MINVLNTISEYSKRPEPFADGTGNIWTEPHLASQMLNAHLNKEWDAASRKEKTIEQTVAYLSNVFAPGSAILDLGCGPGLYAERLTKVGYHVTGVDFSDNSINYARESARKQELDITYRKADFFTLDYEQEFDAVMQIYGELNTFSDINRDRLFGMINKALKPGGVFAFDVSTPEVYKDAKEETRWYTADGGFYRPGRHLVLESTIPYENDVWLEQYIVIDEKGVVTYRTWFHEYTAETIKKILMNAGFNDVSVSDKLYGEEQSEAKWLTVIAKK